MNPPEQQYDKVSLDFLDDKSCPACRMMKASPCYHHFRRLHQCVEFHTQKGDDEKEVAKRCGPYAVLLNDCFQANAAFFPIEVIRQRWSAKKTEEAPQEEGKSKPSQ